MFNLYETILLFFVFAFVGWIWEVLFTLVKEKKFVNRGFLIGPYIPLYGYGELICIVLLAKLNIFEGFINVIFIFALSTIICSILEYFTSWYMEKLFHNRWWDYSNIKFNLNGRICLECSCIFGLSCTLAILFMNPAIRTLFDNINISMEVIKVIDLALILLMVIDTVISFRIINTLKNISDSIIEDSTDKVSKQVKNTIMSGYNILYKRVINSFPSMIIKNRFTALRDRIYEERKKIEKATYKLNIREKRINQLENTLTKLFKRK